MRKEEYFFIFLEFLSIIAAYYVAATNRLEIIVFIEALLIAVIFTIFIYMLKEIYNLA